MASYRIGHRLFYIANCIPSLKRHAAASALKGADAAVSEASGRSLRNSSYSCQKPRTMGSAAQELAPEETGCELLQERGGRRGSLFRGRTRPTPFDMLNSVFPNRNLLFMIDKMDRLFGDPFFHRSRVVSEGRSVGESLSRLPLHFGETDDSFRMRLDLPGLSKDELKVYVEDRSLVIKGEHSEENKADKAQWASSGSHANHYSTRILLPDNANVEMIKAELKNGVLSVTIPKVVEEEPKKNVIDVQIQ